MLPGAYTKWNAMRLFYLWWDVQVLQMEKRHSENNICEKFLPKHPEWKKWKGATLLRQYRASKHSPMVQMADKVIAQLGWDAFRDASVGLTTPKTRAEIFDHLSKVEKLERFPTLR